MAQEQWQEEEKRLQMIHLENEWWRLKEIELEKLRQEKLQEELRQAEQQKDDIIWRMH